MKRISVVLLITMFALTVNAQDDRPVRIGFSAFPATSWITPDSEELTKESNNFGFSYGLLVDFTIGGTPNYAFATGLLINSHGGSVINTMYHDDSQDETGNPRDQFATVEETFNLQYIDIPLALKLKTNEIGYLTYFGEFGLDASFNIKARSKAEGAFADGTKIEFEDRNASDEINLIRMAMQVGAGAEFNISGDTYLMAAIIYNNGLTDIFDRKSIKTDGDGTPDLAANGLQEGDGQKAKSSYVGLQIGVFF